MNFESLPKEKKEKILTSCFFEFSQNKFERASTNEIVKNAGISKGSLFSYFPSKKVLYSYLCHNASDLVQKEYFDRIKPSDGDVLLRLRQADSLRTQFEKNHPYVFRFLKNVQSEDSSEVLSEAQKCADLVLTMQSVSLFSNLDESLFRTDIPIGETCRILLRISEGYSGAGSSFQPENFLQKDREEFTELLAVLRTMIYR